MGQSAEVDGAPAAAGASAHTAPDFMKFALCAVERGERATRLVSLRGTLSVSSVSPRPSARVPVQCNLTAAPLIALAPYSADRYPNGMKGQLTQESSKNRDTRIASHGEPAEG